MTGYGFLIYYELIRTLPHLSEEKRAQPLVMANNVLKNLCLAAIPRLYSSLVVL